MLIGSLSVPFGLARLNAQLSASDLIRIGELRKEKEYDSWSDLFKDFLVEKGIEIPIEHL